MLKLAKGSRQSNPGPQLDGESSRLEVLIVKLDAIGDIVLFTSVLPHLRQLYKVANITLAVQERAAPLLELCPYFDAIVAIDLDQYHLSRGYQRQVLDRLRSRGFDIVINAMYTRTIDSDEIVHYTGGTLRIGFECLDRDGNQRIRSINDMLYTHLVPPEQEWKHELERYEKLLNFLGWRLERPLEPELWLRQDDLDRGGQLLDENHPEPRDHVVALFPGAGLSMRHWQPDKYAAVADRLISEEHMSIVFVGGVQDEAVVAQVMKSMKGPSTSLVGKTSLRELAAVLWRASLYIGSETSGMHISATVGTPLVAIYGGGHFSRFNPAGDNVSLVYNMMDCYYCHWICIYDDFRCVKDIKVDQVYDSSKEVVRRTRARERIQPEISVELKDPPLPTYAHALERNLELLKDAGRQSAGAVELNGFLRLRISVSERIKRILKSLIYNRRGISLVAPGSQMPYREMQGVMPDGWSGETVRILFSHHFAFTSFRYQFQIPDLPRLLPLGFTVKLNGHRLTEMTFPRPGENELELNTVRADLFALNDLNELTIVSDKGFVPKEMGNSDDSRLLVVRPRRIVCRNRLGMEFLHFAEDQSSPDKSGGKNSPDANGAVCRLCDSVDCELVRSANVYRCRKCGYVFTHPVPKAEALEEYYSDRYRTQRGSSVSTPKSRADILSEPFVHFVKGRKRELDIVLRHAKTGRLLDIGCAWGGFLHLAKESGFEVFGVEISRPNVQFANEQLGIPVFGGELDKAGYKDDFFDVVTAIHAFEHLPQPRAAVSEIHRILKSGGAFLCIVPNFDSYLSKKLGPKWKWLTPEDHYSHFTPYVLRNLIQSHGFDVVELFTVEGHYGEEEILKHVDRAEMRKLHDQLSGTELICIAVKR
ncbi:MAG TPA: glycosyltransferase family 9 protein [Bacteroidota bacterium]|jgi:heptosyltransferase-1